MSSLRGISLAAICCFAMVSLAAVAATTGTVTVDYATKSGKSDAATLDAKTVKVLGEQVGVHVRSSLLTPQPVKIKFVGLKDQSYDVYVNGTFVGAKSAGELSEGIPQTIPGRVTDPAAMRMFVALKTKIPPIYDRIHARKGAEPWRAAYTLGQAKEWARTEVRFDEVYRSVLVIAGPAGRRLESMGFITLRTASEIADAVKETRFCLQQARWNMYEALTDPDLRNEVVEALTPVSFTASCSMKNGKPSITASIVNDCDLTITGKITVSAPKGWKTVGAKLNIGRLQSGKTFATSFNLTPSAKNSAVPKSVLLTAVVDIVKEGMGAKLWLYATPSCGK